MIRRTNININNSNNNNDLNDDTLYLDTKKQEEIIKTYRNDVNKQNNKTRFIFSIINIILVFLTLYSMLIFYLYNYSLSHQVRFEDLVSQRGFYLTYLGSIIVYLMSIRIVYRGRKEFQRLDYHSGEYYQESTFNFAVGIGLIISSLLIFFWLKIFYIYEVDNWHFYWIPFGPIFFLLLSIYINSDLEVLEKKVDELNDLKYKYNEL